MREDHYVPVREVMTPDPACIDGLATTEEALRLMRSKGISSLVVNRRSEHDEYGLVRINDIAREVISRNRALERVSVYEIMAKPALTVPADMNIRYAVRLLSSLDVTHSLVMDGGRLVGLVTLRDMTVRHLEAFRESQA